MGKESLEVFRNNFKELFEFADRTSKEGLKARTEDEDDFVPFNVLFPMDMLEEQKYFNLGGVRLHIIFVLNVLHGYVRKHFWG